MERRLRNEHPGRKAWKLPQPRVCVMEAKRSRSILGWHSPGRWKQGAVTLHEIVLTPAAVCQGLFHAAGVVAHELVHLANAVAGIEDTSRQGRYHNDAYRVTAEMMGLTVTKSTTHGWCETRLGQELEAYVRRLIQQGRLDPHAFKYQRKRGGASEPALVKLTAPCGTVAYVTRARVNEQVLKCGECGQLLSVVPQNAKAR